MGVTAIIRLKAKSGQGEALLKAFAGPLEQVRQHPTCFYASMFVSADNPDELLLLEEWEFVESHQEYVAEMRAGGVMDAIMEFMSGAPETTYFQGIEPVS